MKYIFLLIVLVISSCDTSKKTESISIGTKKTEFIEIKDFPNNLKAKNIILAIGDGVGPNQITLSRIAIGGLDHRLFIDQIPYLGTSLTHSYNNAYTDSAAAATAWSTGYKTKNRYLSLDPDKKILDTIVEMLHEKGYASGIVATSSVTHATPAALYAHIDSRYEYKNIANQLINSSIDIALGGGKEFFDLNKINDTHYVLTEKESLQLNFDHSKKLIGLFDDNGINTVGNGIGHDIEAYLDGNTSETIILNDYYEAELDTYKRGKITYPLSGLEEGPHSITLKVWDVYNNSSKSTLDFEVVNNQELALAHVLNYPNPFTTQTEFYFEHNQHCDYLDVQVQIFTVSGKLIKTINKRTHSEGFRSEGIHWNAKDDYGDRIARGVYVYTLRVSSENGEIAEKTEKLVILN